MSKPGEIEAARRRDHVSHFILRLAYCRTEDLRRWFLQHETDLFRARFMHSSPDDIKAFMQQSKMHFTPISREESAELRRLLLAGTNNLSSDQMEGRQFFKVPWTDALELVRSRRVLVKGGFAYVPDTDLVALAATAFRVQLSQALAQTQRALPQLEDDERLLRLLRDLDKRYTGADYSSTAKNKDLRITPELIDKLSSTSFPLCMRGMHDALRATHHLKHGGRLAYGLFLKAAGLSLEDAMRFWRSHFTKTMDVDKVSRVLI